MSISTYSELTAAIESWSHRTDLTDLLPDFVMLAEKRIYHGDPTLNIAPLRLRAMQNQETGSTANGVIALPTRYLETIRLGITSAGVTKTINYLPPAQFSPYETSGETYNYTILENEIKCGFTTGGTYVHDYFAAYAPLTSTATTNALLTNHPQVYLFASLVEVELWAANDAGAARNGVRLAAYINALNNNERHSMAGGSLAVRTA